MADEYYMTVRSNPDEYNSSFFNFKLDKNGNILWKKEFKMNALNLLINSDGSNFKWIYYWCYNIS